MFRNVASRRWTQGVSNTGTGCSVKKSGTVAIVSRCPPDSHQTHKIMQCTRYKYLILLVEAAGIESAASARNLLKSRAFVTGGCGAQLPPSAGSVSSGTCGPLV